MQIPGFKDERWAAQYADQFEIGEIREASDFGEIIRNFSLSASEAYDMFKDEERARSIGVRLYFAANLPTDEATVLLLTDTDERISKVVKDRTEKERQDNGF